MPDYFDCEQQPPTNR